MAHRIVFLDRSTLIADIRSPKFVHEWAEYPASTPDEIIERLRDATIAISNKATLSAKILEQLPRLKMVAIAATGTNNIDVEKCHALGITVCNIRNYARHAVAEHVFALLLGLRRNLFAYREDLQNGEWQKSSGFCLLTHPINDLHGSNLGIIGFGAIGQHTAQIGESFGMHVMVAERKGASTIRPGRVPFTEVINNCDVVSIHCPLCEHTVGIIGATELEQMKPNAILINTARGGIVDEPALLEAIRTNQIAGAGIDVLNTEPPSEGHSLLDLEVPNLIVTPHVGWASREAMQILADQLIDNIEAFVDGCPQNTLK